MITNWKQYILINIHTLSDFGPYISSVLSFNAIFILPYGEDCSERKTTAGHLRKMGWNVNGSESLLTFRVILYSDISAVDNKTKEYLKYAKCHSVFMMIFVFFTKANNMENSKEISCVIYFPRAYRIWAWCECYCCCGITIQFFINWRQKKQIIFLSVCNIPCILLYFKIN